MTIQFDMQLQQELIDHAQRDYPYECCGLLMGQRGGNDTHVQNIIEAQNIAPEHREKNYQIDWRTLIRAVKTTRQNPKPSEQIVGFYHSHPDGSKQPSHLDRKLAWIDRVYLIISIHTSLHAPSNDYELPTLSCWRLPCENSPFVNERIVCSSPRKAHAQLTP